MRRPAAAPFKASVVSLPGNAWLFRYDNTSGQPITVNTQGSMRVLERP
jgi:hypothetical protein